MRPEDHSYLEGFPGGHGSPSDAHDPDQFPPAPAGFDDSYVSHFAQHSQPSESDGHFDAHYSEVGQVADGPTPLEPTLSVEQPLERNAESGLADLARSSHKHKRRLLGLVMLILFAALAVAAIIGVRRWVEQQKTLRSAFPAAIIPSGDNQSVAIAKPTASMGVDGRKSSGGSLGADNSSASSDVNSDSSNKPGPMSGPAKYVQSGPGQSLQPAPLATYDANGKPIPAAPIVPPNRFDSPLGVQDGKGYVNANPNGGMGSGAGNGVAGSSGSATGNINGAAGLFNPMQYLQQMGQGGNTGNTTQSASTGSFSGSLTSTKTPNAKASLIGNRSLMLTKGALIPCVLDTAIVSSVSSMVRCHTPKDVFSEDGKVVLFEAGSQIKGEFSSSAMKTGSKRLYILWSRIDTPLGVKIDLESPGADQLGRGGLDGDLDKHWGERIGSAFLLSFVQDAIAYAVTRGGNQYGPGVYQNTTNTGNQMATEILKDTMGIPPTLSINQGELVNIFVARDLDFSDVYQLRVK